jgi:hypothetical protein
MDLKGILSISGQGGLFKLVSQGKNAVIVENLDTGHRMPAYSAARISSLEDISIYTDEGEASLAEVLQKIKDYRNGEEISNPKKLNSDELKAVFGEILPDYDRLRVYTSDIKKVFSWYNDLLRHGLLDKEPENQDETDEEPEEGE